MLQFNVENVIFGSPDSALVLPEISFQVQSDSYNVGDLIARTVELQVARLQQDGEHTISEIKSLLDKQYIDDEGLVEQASVGIFDYEPVNPIVKLDIDIQYEIVRAQRSFVQEKYFIFINGKQISGLQQSIHSTEEVVEVKFMRIKSAQDS